MLFTYLYLLIFVKDSKSSYIFGLDSLNQFYNFTFYSDKPTLEEDNYYCFGYGIWSRYIPLSNIAQIGTIGILDSNCYHLHHAIEQTTKQINLVYYDCVNFDAQTITKHVEFKGRDGANYNSLFQLNPFEYEYFWYFLGFEIVPTENRFSLYFYFQNTFIKSQEFSVEFPFYDKDLNLIFGGGLNINNNQQHVNLQNNKLSYFPGQMQLLLDYAFPNPQICRGSVFQSFSTKFDEPCECYQRLNSIADTDIKYLELKQYVSSEINCNTFALSTWIRINEINSFLDEFKYQLIKLSGYFQNSKLIQDNLSAFQLFYKMTQHENQILITTYSYTFPIVNLDFLNNPFLITQTFNVECDIKLWHQLLVVKGETSIKIQIIFYNGFEQYKIQTEIEVIQFHMVQFQVQYGNILKQSSSYFKVQLYSMKYLSCVNSYTVKFTCHPTCQECDGPTISDCLSCSQSSKRMYVAAYKSCICIYGTYDDGLICQDYLTQNLVLVKNESQKQQCKYGYFEYQDNCWKCPSIMSNKFTTCLECLLNPKTWANSFYCQTLLYTDEYGNITQFITDLKFQYIFDGNDVSFCDNCQQNNQIYQDYLQITQSVQNICLVSQAPNNCYQCPLWSCSKCLILSTQIICLKCSGFTELVNGICIKRNSFGTSSLICDPPYYLNHDKLCVQCPIVNCLYCFDYQSNDKNFCTLNLSYEEFSINEFFSTGCAQCKDGFVFDFRIGQCLYQSQQIITCLRSYIDISGQELCLLSLADDFSIAPSIIECHQYIQNCQQCFQTLSTTLKCLLCDDEFEASPTTGLCSQTLFQNAKQSLYWYSSNTDTWKWSIQSFINLFMVNNQLMSGFMKSQITSCKDGFGLNNNACYKYCQDSCEKCIKGKNEFICTKCPLNYNKVPLRSQVSGQCLNCPLLCVYCQQRSTQDIQLINPYFQIYSNNTKYTTKCLQKQPDPNIIIDPQLYIARYCYYNNCQQSFHYIVDKFDCFQLFKLFYYEPPQNKEFIENKFNFHYFNEIGLQNYILTLPFKNICIPQDRIYTILNHFKEKVFSFQNAQLNLQGDNPFFLDETINIYNFDSIKINKVQFYVDNLLNLTFQNRGQSIDFLILNSSILSNKKQPIIINFGINSFQSFHLEHFKIVDAIIKDIVLFNININTLGDDIILKDVQLFNSTFLNTSFIILSNLKRNVFIDKLTIDQCQFYNSTFANFILNSNSSSSVTINEILIKNSFFDSFNLIKSTEKVKFIITTMRIEKNDFRETMLIIFNYDFSITDIHIFENYFYQSILIVQISSFYLNKEVNLQNLNAQKNQFQKFQLFLTQLKSQTTLIHFKMISFVLEDNILQNDEANAQFLFDINCFSILIENVFIRNSQNLHYFYLIGINDIKVENINYENPIQNHKVLMQNQCLNITIFNSQLLQVQGIGSLTLNQVVIKNQFTLNQPLISIISTTLNTKSPLEKLQIKNILMQSNILIKSESGLRFSILEINSENSMVIVFENISFIENVFHQYITDPSKSSAGLLFINSMQSSIQITNLICSQNSITNSTSPFISISANKLQMTDIDVKNHNSLKREFWNQYYEILIKEDQNQNQIDYMIKSIYLIKNRGGFIQLIIEDFTIQNGIFSNIIAQACSVFDINTQGEGIIGIQNCHIAYAQSQLDSSSTNDGAISIISQNSYLKLKIQQLTLTEVLNRQAPSIFSIYPSNIKNNIEMRDVFVTNCFSLNNQLIRLGFNAQNAKFNKVLIDNLRISQSVDNLLQYIQLIGILSQVQLQKISIDNSILSFQGCQLALHNFQMEGIVLSSLLQITDSTTIKLVNLKFVEILTIYPIRLITIEQTALLNQNIILQKVLITKLNPFQIKETQLKYLMYSPINIDQNNCNLGPYDLVIQPQNQSLFITYFFKQLTEFISNNQYQQESLIYLQSRNAQSQIRLNTININNNDCQICLNGAIYFDLIDFDYIKVKELECIKNQIKQFGCISAQSNFTLKSKMFVDNSNFLENNGSQGIAISTRKIKVVLTNSKIAGNQATEQGGGIYYELNTGEFLISSTLIFNNNGNEGGGIYLRGNCSLNSQNFNQSLLILNNAQLTTKNLQELPTHLTLSINNVEMKHFKQIINNVSSNNLELKPYKIILQDRYLYTNYLILPSSQQIKDFKIYNPINQNYIPFITKFTLSFKNSFNEQLLHFENSICKIIQRVIDKTTQNILEQQQISTINYNTTQNNFDLGSQTFLLDPYQQGEKISEISVQCQTEYLIESITYNMKFTSFYCQLGEFYISGGCQICQPIQGFYAVTYNTTKCSIFDKNKFQAITSNQIQLRKGYWRPNQVSDEVELCFKNIEYCEGGWKVGDNICKIGHQGGLCEECDIYNIRGDGQFFKKQQDLVCQQCNDLQNSILPFVLILIWAIFSIYLTVKSVEKTNQLYTSLKLQSKYAQIIFKLDQDHESILLKLYLNYLWIFSIIFTFNISFSFSLGFVKQSNDTSYFMANNLDCLLSKFYDTQILYSRVIAMLLLLLSQIIIIYLGSKLISIFYKNFYNDRIISITMLYLYVQNYASLINQFFSILSRRSISQIDYIQGDVSLLYLTENHTQWIFGLAIPGALLIGLILPFSLILFLYFKRDLLDSIRLRRHIGYLFNEYNKSSYFWEWIKLWKKTIIIVIMINFETDIFLKASLIGLCLVAYQFISQRQQPYILKKLNILDIQTCQFCSIAIFLAAVKYRSEQQDSQFMSIFIQTLISILCIWLSYPFIFNILKEYYRKYKQPVLSLLETILNLSKITSQFTKGIQKKLALWKQLEQNKKKNIQILKKISMSKTSSERSGQKITFTQINKYSKLYSDSKRTL